MIFQASEAMKRIQTFLTPLCALDRLSSGIKDIPIGKWTIPYWVNNQFILEFAYAENETSIEEEFQKSMLEITLGDPNNKVKKVLGNKPQHHHQYLCKNFQEEWFLSPL